ncbi:protein phosphatase 2C domain-containing protein [Streptomyces sp. NPDC000405]|uniref:protein phosphatase 2C domain-containing protein n=1 Tax=Streptomyces sp. NPDC000405 TaxID=3161033 RepID=UPI00398CB8EB
MTVHDASGFRLPAPPSYPPDPAPWRRIVVGVPETEFEAQPPGQQAYGFPDTECDGWSTTDFTLRFASVRGANHRYHRRPRQDAVQAAVHESTGAIAFAVADGVSGAASSERGAAEACRRALEMTLHRLSQGPKPLDFQGIAHHVSEWLGELARRLNGRNQDPAQVARLYATTLVTGAVRPAPGGPVVELCRIGDSGAWLLDRSNDHRYRPLFPSKTGSDTLLVSNEVTALPHVPDSLEQIRERLAPHHALLVGTDGFGDPLGDGDGKVGALFARNLTEPPTPLWLAHVLDFSRETFDDDRTLLAIWPRTIVAER